MTTSSASGEGDKTDQPIIEATNPTNTNRSPQIRETKTDIGHHNSNVSIISVLPSLALSHLQPTIIGGTKKISNTLKRFSPLAVNNKITYNTGESLKRVKYLIINIC